MERKTKLYVAKATVIMGAFPLVLWALSAGPNSGKAGVPANPPATEAQCHVGTALNGGGGSVKVTFPGGNVYAPGVKQHLVVTIADPTARNWGFQLTARLASDTKTQAGSFTSTDRFTAVVCGVPPFNIFQDAVPRFRTKPELPRDQAAGLRGAHAERQFANPDGVDELRIRLDASGHRGRQHHHLCRRQCRQRQRQRTGRPHLYRQLSR